MHLDTATIVMGSVAGLALASAAACAAQTLLLRKRLNVVETRPAGDASAADSGYDVIAGRMSSIQSSVTLLQSGLAEINGNLADVQSRSEENSRAVAAIAGAGADAGRREKSRFEPEPRASSALHPSAPINLNRRGQMMRMHRRGESVPAIAAALGISQGEVKLTIRMQELFSEMPEKENSHSRL